ncbi:MAG: PKD domain-containing protein [Burkholderiales bacterium]|nr:PKD domain-containing protein [Burkholderiales bacterium]
MNMLAIQRGAWAALVVLTLAGCGGGGGATETPAALPTSLALSAPAQAEPGATVTWASDLGAGRTGLSFSWDFGDGGSSTQAQPGHAYAQPGRYTVTLAVSNSAGQRVSAQASVQVGRFAMVRDRQCTGTANMGWCWQAPLPDGLRTDDVFFLDAQRGWAVGEGGRVWASSDGGEHWQRLPDVTGHSLTRVAFADAENGWALTDVRARLARTRDGGRSWQTVTTPDTDDASFRGYHRMLLVNRETVVVVGSGYTPPLTKYVWAVTSITTDGGASWRHPALVPDLALPDGSLWQTGYVEAPPTWAGKSADLGLSHAPFSGLPWNAGVDVASALDVWSIAHDYAMPETPAYIFRSRDGGLSFERWPFTPPSGVSPSGFRLALSPQGTGWSTSGPTALRTEDGAKTWSRVSVPVASVDDPSSVWPHALDPDSLWAMTHRQIQLTEDGGRSWRVLTHPDDSSTNVELARDPGGALRLRTSSAQYRSMDGGRHWWPAPGSLRRDQASTTFVGLAFADPQRGMALDQNGIWFDTADGGRQWQRRSGAPVDCSGASGSLQFTGGGQGWALVNGCLMRSTDQGRTWAQAARPEAMAELSALRFHGPQRGWAVATSGQGFATTDGGLTWQASDAAAGAVQAVAAADGSTLWRMDTPYTASLSRSSDGGASWQTVAVPQGNEYRALWFVNARVGWLVGSAGLVLATTDGGLTWQRQGSGSSARLSVVYALDAATVWVAGDRGTVLASATGGQ